MGSFHGHLPRMPKPPMPIVARSQSQPGVDRISPSDVFDEHNFEYCTISTESCFDTNYVKKSGTVVAPPVVFVHGFGASSKHWRATLKDLTATGRTVYAIDLLGFGSSPKPELH